jgi:hypothetical protein
MENSSVLGGRLAEKVSGCEVKGVRPPLQSYEDVRVLNSSSDAIIVFTGLKCRAMITCIQLNEMLDLRLLIIRLDLLIEPSTVNVT